MVFTSEAICRLELAGGGPLKGFDGGDCVGVDIDVLGESRCIVSGPDDLVGGGFFNFIASPIVGVGLSGVGGLKLDELGVEVVKFSDVVANF